MDARPPRTPTREGLEYLGAVAAGLVHEIRNPLSTMNITLQLLQEDWGDAAEEDQKEIRTVKRVTAIRREVNRLEEILDDFLRYAGIRRLDLARSDLNRVLEEVTAFIKPECARVGVTSTFYPDRSLPLIPLDERLIKQAVLNLLLNAIQAMEGASASASASGSASPGSAAAGSGGGDDDAGPLELIVRPRMEGEFVRIDVIDTGPGIPEAAVGQVFDVYYSRKRTGSGLGLPTARRIAEEHGGSLRFETEVGKGTDFILRLPLAGPPQEASGSSGVDARSTDPR